MNAEGLIQSVRTPVRGLTRLLPERNDGEYVAELESKKRIM
jgi:hypothetical protein